MEAFCAQTRFTLDAGLAVEMVFVTIAALAICAYKHAIRGKGSWDPKTSPDGSAKAGEASSWRD